MPKATDYEQQERKNSNLNAAREAGNDEFYTQYEDIEKEVQCYLEYDENVFRGKTILLPCDDPEWSNFTKYFALNYEEFGLKQLISTCYIEGQRGRIAIINSQDEADNITWNYLKGDGDFHSEEISQLRDSADIIATNPPFSLFRDFLAWIVDAKKEFLIIGNMNAITYKDTFPLIKNNQMWLGPSISSGDREFRVPDDYPITAAGWRIDEDGNKYIRVKGVRWFTNIDNGKRHTELPLMNMDDNLKYSRHKELKGKSEYDHYDNYDAIDVPFTDSIPSDYEGMMGVPISFLDKYCPEQFEILGITQRNDDPYKIKKYTKEQYKNANDLNARGVIIVNGKPQSVYARILIRKIK